MRRAATKHGSELSSILHDLLRPLQGLVGYADLLLMGEYGELAPRQEEAVRRLHERILETEENLLGAVELLRYLTGSAEERESSDSPLSAAVKACVEEIGPAAREADVDMDLEDPGEEDAGEIGVPPELFRRLCVPLHHWALRGAGPRGRVRVRVEERRPAEERGTAEVALSVRPAGAGPLSGEAFPLPPVSVLIARALGWQLSLAPGGGAEGVRCALRIPVG